MEVYEKFKTDLAVGLILLIIIQTLYNWSDFNRDSTDSEKRSGMEIHIDALTGCHYLSKGKSSLLPRNDNNGKHICN